MSPECPACGGRMRKRVNRETREAFWGCSRYPQCRGSLAWGGEPESEVAALARVVAELEAQVRQLRYERAVLTDEVRRYKRLGSAPAAPALVRELTRLIGVCHPDRWGGESRVATALTQELLALRAKLQAGA